MIDNFFQSKEWKQFQKAVGKEAVDITVGSTTGFGYMETLPFVGTYMYCPRGPAIPAQEGAKVLEATACSKNARFIRIEPVDETMLSSWRNVFGTRLVKAPHDVQPKETFVVNLTKDETVLLAVMKSKTRYNIRLAQKSGVTVRVTREKKYQDAYIDLIEKTAARKEIAPHPRGYYEKFFTEFPESSCRLFVAEYEGEVLAANLVFFFGTTATYLHGGSGDHFREKMAPYLLHFEQMKEAQKAGCLFYDFGGVCTTDTKSDWSGITKFKLGFSPQTPTTVFPGCYDIILDAPRYALYNQMHRLKQGIRWIKKWWRNI